MFKELLEKSMTELMFQYPSLSRFLANSGLPADDLEGTVGEYIESLDDITLEDSGFHREEIPELISAYTRHMDSVTKQNIQIESLTILGGHNKFGEPEEQELSIKPGEVLCIVGPTGSGKSRLLEDIEWLAKGDTPTGRIVVAQGKNMKLEQDHSRWMVAQLSQNMNFVMDVTVREFITMHAESRMVENVEKTVRNVLEYTNYLSGEQVTEDMFITLLSGGQSRALMIADIACISKSPIVLIDEIENAGINRDAALKLLVKSEKIVLIATHDPVLALLGNRRLIMKNGGISAVLTRTREEEELLLSLQEMDSYVDSLRQKLRNGQSRRKQG